MKRMYIIFTALFIVIFILDIVIFAFREAISTISDAEINDSLLKKGKRGSILKKYKEVSPRIIDTLDIAGMIINVTLGVIAVYVLWMGVAFSIAAAVFGMMLPKKSARRHPLKTAWNFLYFARAICIFFFPVWFIFSKISELISFIFHIKNVDEDNVTEQEIITMVNEGQEQGVLEASEAEMITNIFELGDKNAGDIMTHRTAIVAIEADKTLEEVISTHLDGNFTRFPVYKEDIDHIIGTIHIRDALILYRSPQNRKKTIEMLNTLVKPAFFVPESKDIDDLLKEMQAEKIHLGIVLDEYGQTAGIVSLEDIIEEIVGNIVDEYDIDETELIEKEPNGSFIVDGLAELSEINKLLGTEIESEEFETLNGFLISRLGHLAREDEEEKISAFGYTFRILEAFGNVIRKVEINKEE